MSLEVTSVTDPQEAPTRLLNGWRPRVYRLSPDPLLITRRYLTLAPGLSVQETRLVSGGLRVDGQIGAGMLKIGFVRSDEIRVQGQRVSGPIMAVAAGGSRLNFAATLPASCVSLHFSREAARRIASESALQALSQRLQGPPGRQTLLRAQTQPGDKLEDLARRALSQAQQGPDGEGAVADAIIDACARLIHETLAAEDMAAPCGTRRRELALAVESLLWETPESRGFRRFSLDDAARRLQCSRRSVQLALQEEFGLGFVALKRAIRLQQVHAVLRGREPPAAGVGSIAKAHEFNHLGRFSGQYREMFGVLPSLERAGPAAARPC